MNHPLSPYGPAAKILLVLLRIAIGWHLLYEGLVKLDTYSTATPWSARAYLEHSEGPLSGVFHRIAQPVDPDTEFDEEAIHARWSGYLDRFGGHYGLDQDQRDAAGGELREVMKTLRADLFEDPQILGLQQQIKRDRAAPPGSLTTSERARLATNREILRTRVADVTDQLEAQLKGLLEEDQEVRGQLPAPFTIVNTIDRIVIGGLIISGACLIVGLFCRTAALAGAAMLILFYLAMPPLPGLTAAHVGTSHYLYADKNLIESLALLVLATTHSGRWAGLDVLVHSLITVRLFRRAGEGGKDTQADN